MSYKTQLLKMAIKMTPKMMVIWVANIILKGIAQLTDFSFDVDARKTYVQTKLYGEENVIEIWLEGFSIQKDGDNYHFVLKHAQSNRPWLQNLLSRFVGKAWPIPATPKLAAQIDLIADLLKAEPVGAASSQAA